MSGERTAQRELGDLQAYDDIVARIYTDKIPAQIRDLALALAWAHLRDPARHDPNAGSAIIRTRELLGYDHDRGEFRYKLAFAADAPRYRPPREFQALRGTCDGPRIRPYRRRGSAAPAQAQDERGAVCGAPAPIKVEQRDLATGHIVQAHRFCRRHSEHAEQVRRQIADLGEPMDPPIPNVGGWLARYVNPASLEQRYRWALPDWTPHPAGLCRDDWTTGDVAIRSRRPRLALVEPGTPDTR